MRPSKAFLIFIFVLSGYCIFAQSDWLWGRYGKGFGIGCSVNLDNRGNCFLSGVFGPDSMSFSNITLSNTNGNHYDAFIAKYERDGNLLWVRQSSGNNKAPNNGYVSSTDKAGNLYFTADVADTIIFGAITLTTSSIYSCSSFLVKFDSNGNVVWAKQSKMPHESDTSNVYSSFVTTNGNGNSYITGFFVDTAIFDQDTLFLGGQNGNVFLVKYNTNGNVVWAKESRSCTSIVSGAEGFGEALDKYGDIYVTGRFGDSVYFDRDTLIAPYNTADFFLIKYDSNGNVRWTKKAIIPTSTCFGWGFAATCDQQGNVYVTGEFMDTISFGSYTLKSNGDNYNYTNIFVAKYDSSGNVIWAIQSLTPYYYGASAWSISSDTMGHIYICGGVGSKNPEFIIDKDTLTTTDTALYDDPAFLLKFDTAGHLLCGNIFPFSSLAYSSIQSDPTGNYIYYGSTLATEAIFGKDTINAWEISNGSYPILARWKECDALLGVENISKNVPTEQVNLYPNPSNGKFTISLVGAQNFVPNNIEIYNVLGEKVNFGMLKQVQHDYEIDISNQPAGLYLYRVIDVNGGLIGSGKFVIAK